jgi:hypothetical protein
MKKIYVGVIIACMLVIGTVHAQESPAEIGAAPDGQTSIEIIGHIDQNIFELNSYGYITYLPGLPSDLPFTEDTPAMMRTESTARFTFTATGTANRRSNTRIFSLPRRAPPSTFTTTRRPPEPRLIISIRLRRGTLVASFEGRLCGYCHVCATMSASMLRLYRMMGIYWQTLGDPRPYWGRPRYPCTYDLVKTVQAFLDRAEN